MDDTVSRTSYPTKFRGRVVRAVKEFGKGSDRVGRGHVEANEKKGKNVRRERESERKSFYYIRERGLCTRNRGGDRAE